jgi:hypothetical protein
MNSYENTIRRKRVVPYGRKNQLNADNIQQTSLLVNMSEVIYTLPLPAYEGFTFP